MNVLNTRDTFSQLFRLDYKWYLRNIATQLKIAADVAKLVDALDLGSSAVRHGGSSPSIRTKTSQSYLGGFFNF